MWQTKYASAVPKNLGVGVDFRPCSEGDFPHRASVVRGYTYLAYYTYAICKGQLISKANFLVLIWTKKRTK